MIGTISEESLSKQLLINKLNLSSDLSDIIKSYCFYDMKSWETIQFIKNKKKRIHYLFTNATISRAKPHDVYFHDENTDQQWAFWTYDEEDGENAQFQSYNCKYCGNYRIIVNEAYIDKIVCHCNNDYDDLPELIDIDDNESILGG
jgi:hypothetical protein